MSTRSPAAAAGAPIDAYGVGTKMGVSADAPYLDSAYKLAAYDGRPVMKLSAGKTSPPGAKQVYRGPGGDVLALRDEPAPPGHQPLLVPVMRGGRGLRAAQPLAAARQRYRADLAWLPQAARALRDPAPVPVRISEQLSTLQHQVTRCDLRRRSEVPQSFRKGDSNRIFSGKERDRVPGKAKRYAPEFKEQAARKVVDKSLPIAQVAREIGVNDTTLGFWVKDYREAYRAAAAAGLPGAERMRELERRNRELEMENAFLKKRPRLREGASVTQKYEVIDAEYAEMPGGETGGAPAIIQMCEWLGVSKSGYYEWRSRPQSAAGKRRELLKIKIKALFEANNEEYGYRRMHAALARGGEQACPELVRQLMRELGLEPCQPKPWRHSLTEQGAAGPIRTWSTVISPPESRARKWSATLPTSRPGRDGFILRRSSTARPGKWSGGRWTIATRHR